MLCSHLSVFVCLSCAEDYDDIMLYRAAADHIKLWLLSLDNLGVFPKSADVKQLTGQQDICR